MMWVLTGNPLVGAGNQSSEWITNIHSHSEKLSGVEHESLSLHLISLVAVDLFLSSPAMTVHPSG